MLENKRSCHSPTTVHTGWAKTLSPNASTPMDRQWNTTTKTQVRLDISAIECERRLGSRPASVFADGCPRLLLVTLLPRPACRVPVQRHAQTGELGFVSRARCAAVASHHEMILTVCSAPGGGPAPFWAAPLTTSWCICPCSGSLQCWYSFQMRDAWDILQVSCKSSPAGPQGEWAGQTCAVSWDYPCKSSAPPSPCCRRPTNGLWTRTSERRCWRCDSHARPPLGAPPMWADRRQARLCFQLLSITQRVTRVSCLPSQHQQLCHLQRSWCAGHQGHARTCQGRPASEAGARRRLDFNFARARSMRALCAVRGARGLSLCAFNSLQVLEELLMMGRPVMGELIGTAELMKAQLEVGAAWPARTPRMQLRVHSPRRKWHSPEPSSARCAASSAATPAPLCRIGAMRT